jgi:hypothetical protein
MKWNAMDIVAGSIVCAQIIGSISIASLIFHFTAQAEQEYDEFFGEVIKGTNNEYYVRTKDARWSPTFSWNFVVAHLRDQTSRARG